MDESMKDTLNVTNDELRQFVERIESINATIKGHTDDRKDVFAEAKARGYDPKALRKMIALRKKRPDQIAEEEAIEEVYRAALGM
jgi:uncharacterized protein (UPF0335 family)